MNASSVLEYTQYGVLDNPDLDNEEEINYFVQMRYGDQVKVTNGGYWFDHWDYDFLGRVHRTTGTTMRKLFAMMSAAVSVSPVSAKTDEAHTRLIETLEGVGVTVLYNTKVHMHATCTGYVFILGASDDHLSTDEYGSEWTAGGVDCRGPGHTETRSTPCPGTVWVVSCLMVIFPNYYPNEESLRLVQRSLSREMIGMIMRNYTQMGASAKVLRNALEGIAAKSS